MGLIGFLITTLFIVLGAGYFLFGSSDGTITVESPNIGEQGAINNEERSGSIGSFESIKNQAESVSKQITENSQQVAENIAKITDSNQQTTEKKETTLNLKIIEKKVSFGFGVPSKSRTIDTIVLHSSYDPEGDTPYSVEKVIAIWKGYEVAPHYMIDRKGNIYRLVDDANIAYHAGVSEMSDGRTNVNDFSIGIEILNTKDDKYTDAQYDAVNDLIAYLKDKYSIKNVVGHDDIAPGRKTDPWHFNWEKLK